MWILLIEDEQRLADSLKRGLEEEGYAVDLAHDGAEGEVMAAANAYDLLIVDWRLPKRDGRSLVEDLRAAGSQVPVIMLTALDGVDHRIAGLDAGADDYLAKPFSFEELLARLRALLRRPPISAQEQVLHTGALTLDTRRRRASVGDCVLNLRPKEYQLLELFMRHPEAALSRTVIAERVWGDAFYVSENAIDVTMSGLRQKLAEALDEARASETDRIRIDTIRGVGYRLLAANNP
jgi:DNA-binding response OmpR family regulator